MHKHSFGLMFICILVASFLAAEDYAVFAKILWVRLLIYFLFLYLS